MIRITDSEGHATSNRFAVSGIAWRERSEDQEEPARKQSVMQFVVIGHGLWPVWDLLTVSTSVTHG